jgi:hypothetical protein
MEIKIKNPSLALLIILIVFYIFYKKILDPISENVMKKRYLLESFEGVVESEYFDKHSRNHRYLVLDNGTVLNLNNPYYQNTIKVGQYVKKEFKDSIVYIDNIKFNYLKEE